MRLEGPDGGGDGLRDGVVTLDDLLYFLANFNVASSMCDVDDGSSTGAPDGGVGIEDFLYYLTRYEAGC